MRTLFTVLGLFTGCLVFSQVKPPYKALYEGKEVWVYPFRIEQNYYEQKIPPVAFRIPDGEYVLYYDFIYKARFNPITWKWKEIPIDSNNVAATFTVKDGKKEGECQWFFNSRKKILLAKGNYSDDEKNGQWSFFTYYGGKIYLKEKYVYKDNEYNGPYISYYLGSSRIASEGLYKDNKESGTWKFYSANGDVEKQYTICEKYEYVPSVYERMISELSEKCGFRTYSLHFYEQNRSTPFHGEVFQNDFVTNKSLAKMRFDKGNLVYMDTIRNYNEKVVFALVKLNPGLHDTASVFMAVNNDMYPCFHAWMKNGEMQKAIFFAYPGGDTTSVYFYHDETTKAKDTLTVNYISYLRTFYKKKKLIQKNKPFSTEYIHYPTQISIDETLYPDGTTVRDHVRYDAKQDKLYIDHFETTHKDRYRINWVNVHTRDTSAEARKREKLYDKKEYFQASEDHLHYIDDAPITGHVIYKPGKVKKSQYGTIEKNNNTFIIYPTNNRYYFSIESEGDMKAGKHEGKWTGTQKGIVYYENNYKNGEYHGSQVNYHNLTITKRIKQEARECGIEGKEVRYLSSIHNYKNGMLHGDQVNFNFKGDIISFEQYKEGKKHGVHEQYHASGMLISSIEYKNDWVDGKYTDIIWQSYGTYNTKGKYTGQKNFKSAQTIAEFRNGWLNGEFLLYENGTMLKEPALSRKGTAQNGIKTGEWKYFYNDEYTSQAKEITTHKISDSCYFYFAEQGIRKPVSKDTLQEQDPLINNQYENQYNYRYKRGYSYEPSGYLDHPNKTGYFVSYLKNGNKNMEGRIENNMRVGTWKFYDEAGTLVKEVEYSLDIFYFTNAAGVKDSVMHFGRYKSWYYNGKEQSQGYILNESTKYDCYAELNIPDHELLITDCYDIKGEQLVKNGNGLLKFTNPNGVVISEGKVDAYTREGVWKFYNPDNTLAEIGKYMAGKKHGKWLAGDLDGLNFQDEACFDMNNPFAVQQLEYDKKQVNIQESVFDNGNLIRFQDFNMNLNKEYREPGFRLFGRYRNQVPPVYYDF